MSVLLFPFAKAYIAHLYALCPCVRGVVCYIDRERVEEVAVGGDTDVDAGDGGGAETVIGACLLLAFLLSFFLSFVIWFWRVAWLVGWICLSSEFTVHLIGLGHLGCDVL